MTSVIMIWYWWSWCNDISDHNYDIGDHDDDIDDHDDDIGDHDDDIGDHDDSAHADLDYDDDYRRSGVNNIGTTFGYTDDGDEENDDCSGVDVM